MNISNLSQETLVKLVKLAIESSPTKAAYILLNNETIVSPTAAVTVVEKKPELSYYKTQLIEERHEGFTKIIQAVMSRDKVCAIRELRTISGLALKEAKDTIEMAFTNFFTNIGDMESVSMDDYWVRALVHFFSTQEVILS
jgi:ribosomal protein L7/L12